MFSYPTGESVRFLKMCMIHLPSKVFTLKASMAVSHVVIPQFARPSGTSKNRCDTGSMYCGVTVCGWLLPAAAPPPQLVTVVAGVPAGVRQAALAFLARAGRPISAKAVGGAAGWGRVRAYRVAAAAVRVLLVYFPCVNVTTQPGWWLWSPVARLGSSHVIWRGGGMFACA